MKMTKDGFLKDWQGEKCTNCNVGAFGPLTYYHNTWVYRCSQCRVDIKPHHDHPIFNVSKGQDFVPLAEQASVLFCACADVGKTACHLLMDRNHNMISGIYGRLEKLRADFVEKRQRSMRFGKNGKWHDVEADEVDLRKERDPDDKNTKNTYWEQWGGVIERGDPASLVLFRLDRLPTAARAPGPGPIRKRDWKPIATRFIKDRSVILHTDGAKTYRMHISGVIHDNVVHQKKRQLVDGCVKWINPIYVKVVKHKLPSGETVFVKAGTQIIDGFWRILKKGLMGHNANVGSNTIKMRIRSIQWCYWHREDDIWAKTGELIKWSFN